MNNPNDTSGERGGGSLERMVRPLLDYARPAAAWRLTEKKARMVLESGRPTQIVGLIIRDMDTGQTTVIDQSAVMTLHPSQWNEVMHPKRPNDRTERPARRKEQKHE
jgi:hypothetical protein